MMSLLIDRHPTDLKAYNIRHNTSDSYVRGILKDLRNRYIDRIILLCSSTNTNIVLTQVEQTFFCMHMNKKNGLKIHVYGHQFRVWLETTLEHKLIFFCIFVYLQALYLSLLSRPYAWLVANVVSKTLLFIFFTT